jgi:hypothetical protein
MEEMVKDDVSGYFKRFLISLMTGARSDAPGNPQKAAQLARVFNLIRFFTIQF